ncbi:uncharacterized protein HMPREF1541_04827 [Cyphellophora europaea CBS 101466]|uniref:Glycoside hydrolase family 43 protein n=1 Tax=Cyphellophora europaea (strain CBS 101466) TaxID=1220924 RepID=W2RW53_CYPE1|nr:uncharacterized protein HMPREF1541_04827 [Cyphellophora europaea CBS 101466]ETN40550.1 hypothetical protein HMPREF1541_04827 [Cyphellophora europaea CBS 101466]
MVAIPTYLLAASAASQIKSRSPEPAVESQDSAGFYGSVIGPVVGGNFPDPAVIYDAGTSYAYSTNSAGVHIPMASSQDNASWSVMTGHDALPSLGPWETDGQIWAPDVIRTDSGFVLYYAAATKASNGQYHCIGVATSEDPTGPFAPQDQPLICPDGPSTGGAIDPDGFQDSDGKRYIAYKLDGNANGNGGNCNNGIAPFQNTPIMLQEVDQDGVTLIGGPTQILDRDEADGPLVEAPSLHRSDEGIYFLFFASNCFSSPQYATSYATATSVGGPYTKAARPLLVTGDGPDVYGPGGLDIMAGGNLVSFHGILGQSASPARADVGGTQGPLVRGMYTGQMTFGGREVSFQVSS